jgi:hypothetical protein
VHTRTFIPAIILVVTAPAVTNPYLNSANGTAADTGRAVGEAVGEEGVAVAEIAASAGTAVVGKDAPAGGDMQGACGHSVPCTYTNEELGEADLQLQWFTNMDCWLLGIFDDTIHQNNGTQFNSGIGIVKDAKWQRLHTCIATCSLQLYDLSNGCWAHRFLETLTDLWVGIVQRHWNSEQLKKSSIVVTKYT